MGKLTSLRPTLASLAPLIGRQTDKQGHDTASTWRSWYNTKAWRDLRMEVLIRDLFTCQMLTCGRIEPNTSLLVADHKTPHRGDAELFWSKSNLQTLCAGCHNADKQRQERATRG